MRASSKRMANSSVVTLLASTLATVVLSQAQVAGQESYPVALCA
jgi:hypothetical protein